MTPKHKKQIDALVRAGEKATQDDLQSLTNSGAVYDAISYQDIMRGSCCGCACYFDDQNDADFVVLSFNSREAIKAMRDENERMRDALGDAVNAVEWYMQEHPEDESDADHEFLIKAKQALAETGESDD